MVDLAWKEIQGYPEQIFSDHLDFSYPISIDFILKYLWVNWLLLQTAIDFQIIILIIFHLDTFLLLCQAVWHSLEITYLQDPTWEADFHFHLTVGHSNRARLQGRAPSLPPWDAGSVMVSTSKGHRTTPHALRQGCPGTVRYSLGAGVGDGLMSTLWTSRTGALHVVFHWPRKEQHPGASPHLWNCLCP